MHAEDSIMRTTIKDIARECGVSTATVSLTWAPTCNANKRKKVTRPKTFLTIVITEAGANSPENVMSSQ